jgi:hypothetical protein
MIQHPERPGGQAGAPKDTTATDAPQWTPRTRVVNLRREAFDVYIGRAGKGMDGYFGNPTRLEREADRASVLERYRAYFVDRMERDSVFRARVLELRNKRLGCFCKPKACHGDVIAEYLNGLEASQ